MPTGSARPSVEQLADLVEAVIAGRRGVEGSDGLGIESHDIEDAVALYRAAGRAAIQRSQELSWFQARVVPPDWDSAEALFAATLAPRLDKLDEGRAGWWYLRKYPCWRLRVRTADHEAVRLLLDGFASAGIIAGWVPGVYEPETVAFGGPDGMAITHDLFISDSRGVLTYSRIADPPLGRRELSLVLLRCLFQAAGLDPFEAGDVFARVAVLRPAPDVSPTRVDKVAAQLRPLVAAAEDGIERLFSGQGPLACAMAWRAAFMLAGARLERAAADGELDRGLRAVIAHMVMFHWNRLGVDARTQGVLARAATAAAFGHSR